MSTGDIKSQSNRCISDRFFNQPISLHLIASPDGTIQQVNQYWEKAFGYTPKALMGRAFFDLVHPDDVEASRAALNKVVQSKTTVCFINRYQHKNGQYRVLAWSAFAEGPGQTLYANATDITKQQQAEQSLIESNTHIGGKYNQLQSLIKTIPDLVWLKDTAGVYQVCNRSFEKFFGAKAEDIIGKTDYDFVNKELADSYKIHDLAVIKHKKPSIYEERITFADDGHIELLESTKTPMFDTEGKVIGTLGVGHNITQRKEAERNLALAANVFSHSREGIFITDPKGNIVSTNDAFSFISGYSKEEALGKKTKFLQSKQQPPERYKTMWQTLIEKDHWSGEVWNQHKNGTPYAIILTLSTIRDEADNVINYVGLFTDITTMKEHQEQLEYIAHHDLLTNLPSRILLTDRLNQAMAQCLRHQQSLAVVFLDLDYFKEVNDRYGHDAGDKLLIALAKRLKKVLREGDTLARIGGDEFVAVLTNIDNSQNCTPMLERLLQVAATPVLINDVEVKVSASLGVTLYPQDNVDADQLMRHADQAMYIAKQQGKNRYHWFDLLKEDAFKLRQKNLKRLYAALENNELELYYQPKVNMKTGEIVGTEALIRWQDPEYGLLLPSEFLAIIEDHPLNTIIGKWVMDTALTQISAWQTMGLDIPISINISAQQIQQSNFIECLTEKLTAHPLVAPHNLELEILETSALNDMLRVPETIQACLKLGVHFSLDDFGTGYSSLTYLKRLPVNMIKIDRSFVCGMLENSDDKAIVEGVVGLAKAFQREVIAEGVESTAHGSALLKMGCELAQGFWIAKPMPAIDFPEWAANWQPDKAWRLIKT